MGRKTSRSEFARQAADIGRGITKTMERLQRLAERKFFGSVIIERAVRMSYADLVPIQWRNGNRCSMIDPWRSQN